MQIAFLTCMVVVNFFDKTREKPIRTYFADDTPWQIFKANWVPTWQLRHSEVIELGLPGFSRNTSLTVIPPQHILGQMQQAIISTSEKS
jgi:hypothetical protein